MNIFKTKGTLSVLHDLAFYALAAEAFFIALLPDAARLCCLFGSGCCLLRLWLDKEAHFSHLPFDVPILIFAAFGLVSVFVSPDPAFSFYNYYNLVGIYLLTYFLAGQMLDSRQKLCRLLQVIAAAAVLVVLYGFYQYAFGIEASDVKWVDGEAFPELKKRVFSTWVNPNILAGYLDAAICLAFGFFVQAANRRQRLWLGGGMLLLAICLAMTYARGACLSLAVVLLGYGLLRDKRIFFVCLAAGALIMAIDSTLSQRLISVFTTVDTSTEMRFAFWESTLAMILDHPFLGIGWGAYWLVYPTYDFYINGAPIKIVHAHNLYLNYAAEIGIIGAMAFFANFFGTIWLALKKRYCHPEPLVAGFLLGSGLALISVALNGLTDDVLFNIPSSMFFWLICALVAATDVRLAK